MADNNTYGSVLDRQSNVSKWGTAWEDKVLGFVNEQLLDNGSDLEVVKGKEIRKTKAWEKLAIPIKKNGKDDKVEGDLDLVVRNKKNINEPIAVISCKTSLHGRFSETLFYAVEWKKMIPGIKVFFATPDKGRQAKKGKWESEWGTEEDPTKDRSLAAKYLDGVYVGNNRTTLGGVIKNLEDLPRDLITAFR